jgi:hypothetical protein
LTRLPNGFGERRSIAIQNAPALQTVEGDQRARVVAAGKKCVTVDRRPVSDN